MESNVPHYIEKHITESGSAMDELMLAFVKSHEQQTAELAKFTEILAAMSANIARIADMQEH